MVEEEPYIIDLGMRTAEVLEQVPALEPKIEHTSQVYYTSFSLLNWILVTISNLIELLGPLGIIRSTAGLPIEVKQPAV